MAAAPCRCRKKNLMERRLRFADIPEAFREMRLGTFRVDVYREPEQKKKALAACRMVKEYLGMFREAEERGMGLYLYSGTKGSGKTRMAASIANELMEAHDAQVRFAVSTEILAEIRRTFDKGSEYTQSQVLDALKMVEVLVLDDFGTEKVTEWVADQFYHILNSRYVSRKVTIFTSNESLGTLKEVLVLDDFGTEKVTEWVADQFYHILNSRYVSRKVTIFTSNESLGTLKYDDRITNRIKERSYQWVADQFYHILNSRYVSRKVTIFTSNESLGTLKYDDRITNRIKERSYQIDFPEESVREHMAEGNMQYMIGRVMRTGRRTGHDRRE